MRNRLGSLCTLLSMCLILSLVCGCTHDRAARDEGGTASKRGRGHGPSGLNAWAYNMFSDQAGNNVIDGSSFSVTDAQNPPACNTVNDATWNGAWLDVGGDEMCADTPGYSPSRQYEGYSVGSGDKYPIAVAIVTTNNDDSVWEIWLFCDSPQNGPGASGYGYSDNDSHLLWHGKHASAQSTPEALAFTKSGGRMSIGNNTVWLLPDGGATGAPGAAQMVRTSKGPIPIRDLLCRLKKNKEMWKRLDKNTKQCEKP